MAKLIHYCLQNVRTKSTEIYELDLAHFLSTPGLA